MTPLLEARQKIRAARSLAVLTGAGISAESGIPTFRGSAGLWRQFRPEDLATPHAFARNPELVWEWYAWRRDLIANAKPNDGHKALAALQCSVPKYTLITQNVDGLHQQAGSEAVFELHGSIWRLRCIQCGNEWEDRNTSIKELRRCPVCGSLARPAVVWFGESLPYPVWAAAEAATAESDTFLVVGTSALVYPAAGLISLAKSSGAAVIEVNIEPSAPSASVDFSLLGRAGDLLPELIAR